jgi:hypothetical protein
MSSRSLLEKKLLELTKENERLTEENALLKFELKALKDRVYGKRPKKDPPSPSAPAVLPKKKGALFGHLGWFRKNPDKINKIVEVRLDECPLCCGRDLKECAGIKTHLQEDIVMPLPQATLYRKHRYYCSACRKVVTGRGEGEINRGRIGPLAKTLAAYFKYHVKVSDRDIQKMFSELFGLKFTVGSVLGFRNQLRIRLEPVYENLVGKIRRSRFVHADETGWKIDGKSGWLWSFSNKKTAVCHIDKSRGGKVPQAILGKAYKGVLITDFYSAYNKVPSGFKQRCLVHLLRDIKRVEECLTADHATQTFCARLKTLIYGAVELAENRKNLSSADYTNKQEKLLGLFGDLKLTDPANKITRRFVKRLERYRRECFTFLDKPGIPWHNNHAERMIRPNVLLRKITFGNRSPEGLQNHNVLMSVIQTAKLNRLDPLVRLRELLSSPSPPKTLAALSPP